MDFISFFVRHVYVASSDGILALVATMPVHANYLCVFDGLALCQLEPFKPERTLVLNCVARARRGMARFIASFQ